MRLEVDRGVDQGLLALAPPEPRHRLPERRVGLDLVDVEAPRPRVALGPAEEPVRRRRTALAHLVGAELVHERVVERQVCAVRLCASTAERSATHAIEQTSRL